MSKKLLIFGLMYADVVVVGFKANCPLMGSRPIGGMPNVEVFGLMYAFIKIVFL